MQRSSEYQAGGYQAIVRAIAWVTIVFLVFPVLLTVIVSFNASFFIEFPPKALSIDWYGNIAKIHRIGHATFISALIALASATVATLFGICASLALVRTELPAKAAITAFLVSPITIPMVAIGIALVQFFILIGTAFTWYSLLIGHIVLVLAYPIRTLVASLTLSNISL